MNILRLITGHKHYWGIPHWSETDKRLIQICYECGAHRTVMANLLPLVDLEPRESSPASSSSAVEVKRAA